LLAHSVLAEPLQTLHDVSCCCATASSSRARFWTAGHESQRRPTELSAPRNQATSLPRPCQRFVCHRNIPLATRACCNMPPKRASEDEPQLVSKIQRIEHGVSTSPPPLAHNTHQASSNDFSTSVKRKLADSKRTGQACDRCKVRLSPTRPHLPRPSVARELQHCNAATANACPDPQDSLRWPARGMHALRAEQDAVPDDGPHHRPRHGARPR
jgi:hypothetical protein